MQIIDIFGKGEMPRGNYFVEKIQSIREKHSIYISWCLYSDGN